MWVVKECTKCKEVKLFNQFPVHKSGRFGTCSRCDKCNAAAARKYYNENKEKCSKAGKKWALENKEKIKRYNKKYKEENREYYKEYHKEYYRKNKNTIDFNKWAKDNPEKYRDTRRKWELKNKEKISKYKKKHREKESLNPFLKFKRATRNNITKSIKRGGYKKGSSSFNILGCPFDVFKQHIERQFQKGMTWDNYGDWHLDHIIPMASATTEEEVLKLNHYTNFQPLWAEDNLKKSDKIIEPIQMKLRI